MKPGIMETIGKELEVFAQLIARADGVDEPSPKYVDKLAFIALDEAEALVGIRTYAANVVCQYLDSATGRVLDDFPEACRDVAAEFLRDHQASETPVHDLGETDKAALQLAHAVLCFVTRGAALLPPREETE